MAGIDFPMFRSQVSIGQVLDLLNYEPTRVIGRQLRGPCPIHGSTTPKSRSFSVNLERNIFHCFSCGAHGNQLDLWIALTNLPVYDAAINLCERLGIDVPRRDE